ncbi:hypothetical protein, partial [Brevibacillus borstelensis]|uniref:hypothetical protein n=1 Tax=Brevibacillus borstelensis TaxID=45462 RepID=UPI0030BB917C
RDISQLSKAYGKPDLLKPTGDSFANECKPSSQARLSQPFGVCPNRFFGGKPTAVEMKKEKTAKVFGTPP